MNGKSRVAVIGGGIAGLVAAERIADAGSSAVMFEAGPHLGGRARTRVLDGFHFNQGPHALYVNGALSRVLREKGVVISGGPPDLSAGLALWGVQAHALPLSGRPDIQAPLDAAADSALRAFFARLVSGSEPEPGCPVRSVLDELPAGAREVAAALVRLTTYVDAPDDFDARAAMTQLRLSLAGTIYVDGGWSTLVDGLAAAARAAGAELKTRARVMRIEKMDDEFLIENPSETTGRFDAVVLAVPPAQALALAGSPSALAKRLTKMRPVRISGLDIALASVRRPTTNFALDMKSPQYFSMHSAAAQLAPASGGLLHVARYHSTGERPQPKHFEDLRRMLDRLQPAWREQVVHEQRLSGATVAHDFPHWENGGRRVDICGANVPGIYLAGDWVGTEGLLSDASAASARLAAEAALEFARPRKSVHEAR